MHESEKVREEGRGRVFSLNVVISCLTFTVFGHELKNLR